MKKPTEEVQEWLVAKDFNTGITILSKYRAPMARILKLRGPRHLSKLEYELKKIAGLTRASAAAPPAASPAAPVKKTERLKPAAPPKPTPPSNNSPAQKKLVVQLTEPHQVTLSSAHKSLSQVPPQIETIAKEHARLFMLRSQLADQRYALPKTNDKDSIKQRKVLTDSIHELSEKIETLFHAHSDFMKNRIMPNMSELFPSENQPDELPPESEEEAYLREYKRQRSSLMSSNRRDRIVLNYSQPKQLKNKAPLPDGPEREKIEKRVLARQKEIEQLEAKIKQLKN